MAAGFEEAAGFLGWFTVSGSNSGFGVTGCCGLAQARAELGAPDTI